MEFKLDKHFTIQVKTKHMDKGSDIDPSSDDGLLGCFV
jgi:hypothetical protein